MHIYFYILSIRGSIWRSVRDSNPEAHFWTTSFQDWLTTNYHNPAYTAEWGLPLVFNEVPRLRSHFYYLQFRTRLIFEVSFDDFGKTS